MTTKILIIGACGQIGTELTKKLREQYGQDNVIASDIRKLNVDVVNNGIFEVINALDYNQIEHLVEQYQITDVYLMAALLSATAEKKSCLCMGFEYEFAFSCFEFGKNKKNKKNILAIKYCRIWTNNTTLQHTTIYYNGTNYGIWNF